MFFFLSYSEFTFTIFTIRQPSEEMTYEYLVHSLRFVISQGGNFKGIKAFRQPYRDEVLISTYNADARIQPKKQQYHE